MAKKFRTTIRYLRSDNLKSKIQNPKSLGVVALVIAFTLCGAVAQAGQAKVYRVGVITAGGVFYETIDGLRFGLRQLGLEEGKQFNLAIRDTKGDVKAAEEAARNFEKEKVDLIYTTQASVTIAAKRATADIPIVFCAGADPVVLGFVESFAKSGGRLTGVYQRDTEITAKRLEILKEIVPKLRRVVTFFDPRNPVASESAKLAREEAARLKGVKLIERHFASIEELRAGVRALRVGEVDAFFQVSDAMVINQAQMIVDAAKVKRLPTMFLDHNSVINGGLAAYAVSRHEVGRVSAKYVQRVLAGAKPNDMPVEGIDKIDLVINLKTAKEIGLTVPPNVPVRAQKVIR